MASILVVDDDRAVRDILVRQLKDAGYDVDRAANGREALRLLEKRLYDLVVCDVVMDDMSGIEVLKHSKHTNPDVEVIIMTAFGNVEDAVEALRNGAFHYITKPINKDTLLLTVKNALEKNQLRVTVRNLQRRMRERLGIENIVTASARMQKLLEIAASVAHTDSNVLITGESGTGKEVIANLIHNLSPNAGKPFVAVNCGGLPEPLLESELFGHVKGAFTGAITTKKGLVEEADQGTLFLDEVGEMTPALQVKLLRFLENGEFRRVGENITRKVNVRVIAATNKDLQQAMQQGEFREDLYYRLSVIPLHIPPLRERPEDIPLLAQHFLRKFSERLDKKVDRFSDDALQALISYRWPGNVRELMNAIEHGVALCTPPVLEKKDLPPKLFYEFDLLEAAEDERLSTLEEMEKNYILKVLHETGWNQRKACRILGLSKATLYRRLKKYGIRPRLMVISMPS